MPHSVTDRALERDRRLLAGHQHELATVREAARDLARLDVAKQTVVADAANRLAVTLGYQPAFVVFRSGDQRRAHIGYRINPTEALAVPAGLPDDQALVDWLSRALGVLLTDGYRDGLDALAHGKRRDKGRVVRSGDVRVDVIRVDAGGTLLSDPPPRRMLLVGHEQAKNTETDGWDVIIANDETGRPARVVYDRSGVFAYCAQNLILAERPEDCVRIDLAAHGRVIAILDMPPGTGSDGLPDGSCVLTATADVVFVRRHGGEAATLFKHRYAPSGGRWQIVDRRPLVVDVDDATGCYRVLADPRFELAARSGDASHLTEERHVLRATASGDFVKAARELCVPAHRLRVLHQRAVDALNAAAGREPQVAGQPDRPDRGGHRDATSDEPSGTAAAPAAACPSRQVMRPAAGLPLVLAEHPSADILHDRAPVAVTVSELLKHPLAVKHPDRFRDMLERAAREGTARWHSKGITLIRVDKVELDAQMQAAFGR